MKSVNWRSVVAYGVRLVAVVAMTGFVAWLPGTRTTVGTTTTTVTTQVSWGGGTE